MKLNLGCGSNHRAGYVNVDRIANPPPDMHVDLESLPWPFADNCADEIVLSHVLEHLGRDPDTYLGIIKELYRISAPGCVIHIGVPHPRNDLFAMDPTHVRVISPDGMSMFSKAQNRDWQARGMANTPLALELDVDFQVTRAEVILMPDWMAKVRAGSISQTDLDFAIRHYFNVAAEFRIDLTVIK